MKTYVSLFSSAGVGCYGFKQSGYECIATNELIDERLAVQKANNKCKYDSGYIAGDILLDETKDKILKEISMWHEKEGVDKVDVVIATPPCQGMSTANYKKNEEQRRNSLVVEAIKMIVKIRPKVFIFENVRAFMKTICTDVDGTDKTIEESIFNNLSNDYNISARVVNFKDYGVPSSRPRTLVVGTLNELQHISPLNIFPRKKNEITVRDAIGDLKHLEFCERDADDVYHFARPFPEYMLPWIENIGEGESALNNPEETRPYKLVKGERKQLSCTHINNKFRRLFWDRPGACIHTRNDIICSQDTIHPVDNRVLSIRELMRLMTIPDTFRWNTEDVSDADYLKKHELNIRRSIGEAVPTFIMYSIAKNVSVLLEYQEFVEKGLTVTEALELDVTPYENNYYILAYVYELRQNDPKATGVYYTPQAVVFDSLKHIKCGSRNINILEPSVGMGAFLPQIISACYDADVINIDAFDIDGDILELLRANIDRLGYCDNIHINTIHADFLTFDFKDRKYDIVVGNPPYVKYTGNDLKIYRTLLNDNGMNNSFAFFMKKMRPLADEFALVIPKTFLMSPEYNGIRNLYEDLGLVSIVDYGVKAFAKVFVEIISITFKINYVGLAVIEDRINGDVISQRQGYVCHDRQWLIYRDEWFDQYIQTLTLDYFDFYRPREITNKYLKNTGKYWVIKSKNILDDGSVVHIEGYDKYIDDVEKFNVKKYLDSECIIMPSFTYNTRATRLPNNAIANGSIAFLIPKEENLFIDLSIYATEEFRRYYAIVKNKSKFTINIDANAIYYIGARMI